MGCGGGGGGGGGVSMNYLGQLALEALENTQLKSNFENSEIEILS